MPSIVLRKSNLTNLNVVSTAMHGVILLQKLHQIGDGYSDVLLLLRYIFENVLRILSG